MENNTIYIIDTVTNESGLTQPSMQLYHMNMGYPLLDEGVELLIPAKTPFRETSAPPRESTSGIISPPPHPALTSGVIITVSALRTEKPPWRSTTRDWESASR